MQFTRWLLTGWLFLGGLNTAGAATVCSSANSDPDGDGWGWENNASCIVHFDDPDKYPTTEDGFPVCVSASSDHDNDGWGWENHRSCKVGSGSDQPPPADPDNPPSGTPTCRFNSDPDGDGYGWENHKTCLMGGGGSDPDQAGYGPANITDLILITGQSNTLGANTGVNSWQDTSHPRVFAYTSNGWEVAALHQRWDQGSYPGTGQPSSFPTNSHNNFALHFGKKLVESDSQRVVGFILVSEPGEGIQHWDNGRAGMTRVESKVVSAVNELPHKSRIDGILWHQGETDWQLEGTSDPDVSQPAPWNYYPKKLSQLIVNLRNHPWATSSTPFICGETISATGVNTHLMALNHDNDANTACVAGFGLPSRNDGAHMNAEGLRTIGARYATRYREITQ